MDNGHLSDSLDGVDHFDLLGIDPRTGRLTLEQLRKRSRDVCALLQRGAPFGQAAQPVPFTLQQANVLRDWLNQTDNTGFDEPDGESGVVRLTDREILNLFYARYDINNRRIRSSWNPFATATTGLRLTTADPAIMQPVPGVAPRNPAPPTGQAGTTTTVMTSSTGFFGGPSYTTTHHRNPGSSGSNTTGRNSTNSRNNTGNTGPNTPTGHRRRTAPNAFGKEVIVLDDDDEDDEPVFSPSADRTTGQYPPPHRSAPPTTPASGSTGPPPASFFTPMTGPAATNPPGFVHIPRPPPGFAAQFPHYAGPITPAAAPPPAPAAPRLYTGPTNQTLPTLEIRAGDPAGIRVVIGLVRPVDGQGNVLPAAPVLIATVGADRLGRVNYRIIGRDINGAATAGAGRSNSLNYQQLVARGLVLLGRFRGATEGEIRTFAVDRSNRTDPNSPLPRANHSPRNTPGSTGYSYTPTGKSGPRRSRSPSSPSRKPSYRSRDPPAGGAGGASGLLS